MNNNKNKRRRYFDNNEIPHSQSEVLEEETLKTEEPKEEKPIVEEESNDKSVAELSAPKIYAKNVESEPVKDIPKNREYPTVLETPKTLERNKRRVKARSLRIRKEPSRASNIIGLIKQEEIITVDLSFKNDDWCKIVDDSGNEKGYVMKDFVTPYA